MIARALCFLFVCLFLIDVGRRLKANLAQMPYGLADYPRTTFTHFWQR